MRTVLLIEPDLDKLGTLASELRARGLVVLVADGQDGALRRARGVQLDALLLSSDFAADVEAVGRVLAEPSFARLPRITLVAGAPSEQREGELTLSDPDGIALQVFSLPPRGAPVAAERGDFRGDLAQVGVVDLLQLLEMNRRTGVLSVTTAAGAGEIRMVDGEIVDAVYRRLEAEKALYRVLGESDGSFAFAGGAAAPMRRISVPTRTLLMEGLRQNDELRRERRALALDEDALLAVGRPPDDAPELVRRVAETLTAPLSLDELLDEVPGTDLEVIGALARLLDSGVVRRISRGVARAELAAPEQLAMLGALVRRMVRPGFTGAVRLVLAGSTQQIATIAHSVRRLVDASPPPDAPPAAPVPHLLATLRVTEEVDLDVVGLPTLDAYAPLWGLTLPGTALIVELPAAASNEALAAAAAVHGIPVLAALALSGAFDDSDPAQIAALLRSALDAGAGRRDS
ncbi:MAG: DUF4388 domain-containing protein [Sorangiineae bacterium]|nr:DUF4388 domain-containing protein [Polyangiaceae bacterium]MEB2321474.1 DUF4388 domain-containing protein [Sorangiineae bacterium]